MDSSGLVVFAAPVAIPPKNRKATLVLYGKRDSSRFSWGIWYVALVHNSTGIPDTPRNQISILSIKFRSWSSIKTTVGSPRESLKNSKNKTVEPNKLYEKKDRYSIYSCHLSASTV